MNPDEGLETLMNNKDYKISDPEWKNVQEKENATELAAQQLIYRYQQADEKGKEVIRNEVEKAGGVQAVNDLVVTAEDEFVPKSRR